MNKKTTLLDTKPIIHNIITPLGMLLKKYLGLVLFLIMLFISIFSYKEYGLSWDEPIQRKTGSISYNYIFEHNPHLLSWKDRDYGVAFELPLYMIEKVLKQQDRYDIFCTRHLVTHIFFLLGALAAFLLIDSIYKNKMLATLAFLFLVLNPRIYTHSFFNTKDLPFLSMLIMCLYLTRLAFNKKNIIRFILLGIGVGLLINIRIMGVIVPATILLFLFLDIFFKEGSVKKNLLLITLFTSISLLVLYASWPFLWHSPIKNFIFAFKNMSKFRWGHSVLFGGQFILAEEIGWQYFPVWFAITTPIIYILTFLTGVGILIANFFRKPIVFFRNNDKRINILFAVCAFAPIMAVIILKSVLYDGWRQLYFVYPPMVFIGIYGLNFLLKRKNKILGYSLISVILLSMTLTASFMIVNYPFNNVYFNALLSKKEPEHIRKSFDMDYWGTSYKQALEYILSNDSSQRISICVANPPGRENIRMLKDQDRKRIRFTSRKNATYFITNFRGHPDDYDDLKEYEYHSFKFSNNTINKIFKLK